MVRGGAGTLLWRPTMQGGVRAYVVPLSGRSVVWPGGTPSLLLQPREVGQVLEPEDKEGV